MTDLLNQLNLTEQEEAIADFSDVEDEAVPQLEWVQVGKVLSPTPIHVNTDNRVMYTVKHVM